MLAASTRSAAWIELEAIQEGDATAVVIDRADRSRLAPLLLRALGLTQRELEVAMRLLAGESNDAIATALDITRFTVKKVVIVG